MRKQTRVYGHPAHGVRVCQTLLHEAEVRGEALCSVEKGYILGTGVTFRMFFTKGAARKIRVVMLWGGLRDDDDDTFTGQRINAVLSMKLLWITLGYYYFLEDATLTEPRLLSPAAIVT